MSYITRLASLNDILAITDIYNEAIEDKIATLETSLVDEENRKEWLLSRSERHSVLVIVNTGGEVLGWASLNIFNSRCCYEGVVDISIYIKRDMRGKGLGKSLLSNLILTAKEQKFHKLVLSAFNDNLIGKKLYSEMGFREVGVYERQGILDGQWKDIVIMEKLLV